MTAEVAVMNKQAVALAADSAVTIRTPTGNLKVYNNANKLFTLSKFAPVGILIYGSAELNRYPIEILVKQFREKLGRKRFPKLSDYAEQFFKFLEVDVHITKADKNWNLLLLTLMGVRRIYRDGEKRRSRADDKMSEFPKHIRAAMTQLRREAKAAGRLKEFKDVDVNELWNTHKKTIRNLHKTIAGQYEKEHGPYQISRLSKIELLALA